ncbi:MAG: hypothetical protein KAG06_07940 [Methylococcales bacterium]|nr:hypothetical protein [Methylococcales bacterium]
MSKKVNFFKKIGDLAAFLGKTAKHLMPVFALISMMEIVPHDCPERIQDASFGQIVKK